MSITCDRRSCNASGSKAGFLRRKLERKGARSREQGSKSSHEVDGRIKGRASDYIVQIFSRMTETNQAGTPVAPCGSRSQ